MACARPSGEKIGVTVVCPFYNEEQIIRHAVESLLAKLEELETDWELIVVNDGSLDRSAEIVREVGEANPRLRLVSYAVNKGRGHALRQGIAAARGEIVVTTEIDLSWGEDIVDRLWRAMQENPRADIIVASPHLKGGGYRNVPFKRVLVSGFGNWVIRAFMANAVSMNTGMTRAYRRQVIQTMPLEEDGKEFHLEVILKALALRYKIYEIPSLLEWKEHKQEGPPTKRKSSSKVNKLIVSHTLFSVFANPIRHVWALSGVSAVLASVFLVWGILRFSMGLVSVYMLIVSLSLAILALMLFAFGIIAHQGNAIQREIWTLKRELIQRSESSPADRGAAREDV